VCYVFYIIDCWREGYPTTTLVVEAYDEVFELRILVAWYKDLKFIQAMVMIIFCSSFSFGHDGRCVTRCKMEKKRKKKKKKNGY
jgi:hypothetical protein